MKIQYISDSQGHTTAVVIPIDQWNEIKAKHADIEEDENDYQLPQAARAILDERIASENKADFISAEDAQTRLRLKYGL